MLGEEVDGMLRERLALRRRQVGPVEARFAMDVRRDEWLTEQWAVCIRSDGDVVAADEVEHADRVRRRLLERLVPGDGRDADQLDLRAGECEQERDRIVVTGVAVD